MRSPSEPVEHELVLSVDRAGSLPADIDCLGSIPLSEDCSAT